MCSQARGASCLCHLVVTCLKAWGMDPPPWHRGCRTCCSAMAHAKMQMNGKQRLQRQLRKRSSEHYIVEEHNRRMSTKCMPRMHVEQAASRSASYEKVFAKLSYAWRQVEVQAMLHNACELHSGSPQRVPLLSQSPCKPHPHLLPSSCPVQLCQLVWLLVCKCQMDVPR